MKLYHSIRYYLKKFASYHISTYAASASFFIMSALFPLLMLVFSVLSYTPFGVERALQVVSSLLPGTFQALFQRVMEDLMTVNVTALSVSVVAVIWTAGKSMLGLVDGLNAIAEVNDTRNFVLKRIVCIVYMLVMILVILCNLALSVFGEWIQNQLLRFLPRLARIFAFLLEFKGVMLLAAMVLVFVLIYSVFPNKRMRVLMQIPGAVFTSLGWILFSRLFSLYVDYFPSVSALYGSLGVLILAMLWLYFCMYIVFVGAVINRVYPALFWKCFVIFKYRHSKEKVFLPEEQKNEK